MNLFSVRFGRELKTISLLPVGRAAAAAHCRAPREQQSWQLGTEPLAQSWADHKGIPRRSQGLDMQHLSLAVKGVIRRFVLETVLELTNHQSRSVAADSWHLL